MRLYILEGQIRFVYAMVQIFMYVCAPQIYVCVYVCIPAIEVCGYVCISKMYVFVYVCMSDFRVCKMYRYLSRDLTHSHKNVDLLKIM